MAQVAARSQRFAEMGGRRGGGWTRPELGRTDNTAGRSDNTSDNT